VRMGDRIAARRLFSGNITLTGHKGHIQGTLYPVNPLSLLPGEMAERTRFSSRNSEMRRVRIDSQNGHVL
jgi:hypothetical protein